VSQIASPSGEIEGAQLGRHVGVGSAFDDEGRADPLLVESALWIPGEGLGRSHVYRREPPLD
jgi:hypothetical protein